jgi:hypothetical protein
VLYVFRLAGYLVKFSSNVRKIYLFIDTYCAWLLSAGYHLPVCLFYILGEVSFLGNFFVFLVFCLYAFAKFRPRGFNETTAVIAVKLGNDPQMHIEVAGAFIADRNM